MVTTPNYDLDIDTTLGGNNASDYVVPSQKAIKAYVDNSTGGNVMWGNIAGNISDQTDLQDALDDKQDTLVSGTNIKTINNTSLLGSGNIDIQGGGTITVDDALSTTSTNPVQNKVITNALPDISLLSYYGTCSTAAATQAKVVICPEFTELKEGVSIRVKFNNAQSYNGAPTLNVNSTGAKSVKSVGTTNSARYCWLAGEVVSFTYDGTNWIMEDAGIATTTYYGYTKLTGSATSTSSSTALTPSSLNNFSQNMISGADVYSTSKTYAVGDRVRYSSNTWECITEITTAEAWTAAHWQALDPVQTQLDNKANTSDLATVATSGSYNDLSDKPTIPTVPTIATSVSASSTNAETVGAKLFYDTCGNIESLLSQI